MSKPIDTFWVDESSGAKLKEGGPYSPDPRNTDATWSIFYTKVHLYHRSKKKKNFFGVTQKIRQKS